MSDHAKTDATPKSEPNFFSPQVREATRFYLDLAPPVKGPPTVVCGGRERCNPDYIIRRDTFPYCSLEFVAQGKGTLTLAGRKTALLPGAVFTYGPGVPHEIATSAESPLVKYFVDFAGRRAAKLLDDHGLAPGSAGRVLAPASLEATFEELIQNGLKNTRFSSRICTALLECLVLKTAESLLPGQDVQGSAFAAYQRCRQHIQSHCAELRTLTEAARGCHVDPAYLCRLFQRFDHQTPYQFLLRLKMNLAASRIQTPGAMVKQVAAELDFDDPCHFSRAFKSVFGLSPEAFRRLR
jgi:AraC-like DNA-binding protein